MYGRVMSYLGQKRKRQEIESRPVQQTSMKELAWTLDRLKERSHELISIVPVGYVDFVADALEAWKNNVFLFGMHLQSKWSNKFFYETPVIEVNQHSTIPDLHWLATQWNIATDYLCVYLNWSFPIAR